MQRSRQPIEYILSTILILVVIAAFLTRSPYNIPVPPRDSGIFIHIGSEILQGKVLYLDTWDNKQPLLYFINAAGLWIGKGSIWGVWGFELALLILLVLVSYRIARKSLTPFAGFFVVASSFFGIFQLILGNYSEEYAVILQMGILALLFLGYLPNKRLRSRPLFALGMGILAGLAFCLKPTYLDIAISVGTYLLFQAWFGKFQGVPKHVFMMILGFLLVNALVFLYFLLKGALNDYIIDAFLFNAHYAGQGLSGLIHSFLEVLEYIYNSPYLFIMASLWLVIVFVLLVKWRFGRQGKFSEIKNEMLQLDQRHSAAAAFLFLGLVELPVVLGSIALSGRNFSHYYISLFPALFLLLAGVLSTLQLMIRQPSGMMVLNCSLAAFLVFGSYVPALQIVTYLREPGIPDEREIVAEYIRENSTPEDKILVWGWESIIYFLAGRESPTRYALQFPAYLDTPYRQAALETLQNDVLANPPRFIVDTLDGEMPFIGGQTRVECLAANPLDGDNLHSIINYVCSNYTLVKDISGYQIYQRDH